MKKRIIGFDLARAYAIFGMFIVNFNVVFGKSDDHSLLGGFLTLFGGHSSTVFVMLAGMGVALMTNRGNEYTPEDKKRLRNTILKRAAFLFVFGLLFYLWWPADILRLYGVYMSIGAFLVFLDKKYYLIAAILAVVIFHLLLFIIPYETGWNFNTLEYQDFWTLNGFLRNTFYNGWNPVFPWFAYFATGLYLGRQDWTLQKTQWKMFKTGLIMFVSIEIIRLAGSLSDINPNIKEFLDADYIPPFLPFILNTTGFGLMLIAAFMYVSRFISDKQWGVDLARTGQMTLTHYVSHLTIGLILLGILGRNSYAGKIGGKETLDPLYILLFSIGYFIVSMLFTKLWGGKFKQGPLEMLMRKISG
ncbi:hypothetical protein BAX97_14915 [Elizabethkingia meningoseptica]|uniref:DUF418 domain-containing protein n=1 Tax=Elizabethkingia meningoseptica TaxID=238 RepID=UPI000332D3A0|nr:DUF418 domain-containing protein [Elizabethkingia meningoseptica]AQX05351.1 hypothetical protein BBD33_08875 [Elizabethkingia meningoseptica]AQX47394.1 hypothetical protein B5G46_08865 [Elizabethkingia meningoseptica]EOR31188.1 hypothetical protein L100_02952 [Elizabethkingia meningoseptica ATCC 13253 = NBRC 12535]KUY24342.1 hypothetical protein ATB99_02245 [Elizabethkingia meningoseptica]MDE5489472.1 DUF418 domain-containing protein [Elizabethkingia meningoseptica]